MIIRDTSLPADEIAADDAAMALWPRCHCGCSLQVGVIRENGKIVLETVCGDCLSVNYYE